MLWVAVLVVAGVVYFLVDPSETRWMPQCPVHMLTGLQCPGCGAQRLIHALLHGDIGAAWHANAFLLLSIPGIAFLGWLEMGRRRHAALYARVYSTPVIVAIGILLVAWGVGRNLIGI